MSKRVDNRKCSSEKDILKVFASRFSNISDFSVETGNKVSYQSEARIFDIVVHYGNQPIAIAEIKNHKDKLFI